MTELNDKAQKIFALKYSTRKTKTWKEKCRAIASMMSKANYKYGANDDKVKEIEETYYNYLVDLLFLPGGRIIANAGTDIKNLANCFVLGIDDSRQSIYETLKNAAEVFAMGGGCGYDFSNIREEGCEIKSTNGKASGPLSFMTLFDQTGEVIQQASRRGAQIGLLNVSHPDIEKFIGFKSKLNTRNERLMQEYDRNLHTINGMINGTKYERILEKTLLDDQLTHFNISVLITDEFMEAVEKDEDWNLISPSTGQVVKTIKAKYILELIAKQAWESADPGILMKSRINEDNIVSHISEISATNPCGEVPLISNESCILASVNLHKMYNKDKNDIDWILLKNTVKTMIRFLEDVTEITEAPIDKINETTKSLRRLGAGVLGFADLLVDLGIPYDSDDAVLLSETLSWFISFHSWETSIELAKERGHFAYFDYEKANLDVVRKTIFASPYESEYTEDDLKKYGIRNNCVNSIAPTGSIALIGGVNGSIEPFFALAYKRNITEGVGNIAKDSIFEVNPALEYKLKENGYNEFEIDEILEYVYQNGSLQDCPIISKELQLLFRTANEISWKRHIDIQAAWQKYFSNAISKTVNIPENSTWEDIYNIYLYMWKNRLKGGTIYRNNSKSFQILEKPVKKGE